MPADRICPGRWFAFRTLFLNIACTLAVFDIEAPADEKLEAKFREFAVRYVISFGVSVTGYSKFADLLHVCCLRRHCLPFKCVVRPRSEARMKVVRDAVASFE